MTIDPSTTTAGWPTQLRLPGQAAAPDGPCDLWMMYVAHHAYRRDLDRFVRAAQQTQSDDTDTWRALAARWALFGAALHHHHHAEDVALWPLLESRADDRGRRVLAAMQAEHAGIDPVLEAITAALTALTEPAEAGRVSTEDTRAALVVRLVDARQSLGAHLAHEETEAIALMQTLMTEPEWLAMQQESFRPSRAELDLTAIRNMLGWTVDGLPAAVRDRVLADPPVVGRLLWLLTRRGWFRRERRAFRPAG